ncbi:hypothetical protein HD554DRAFT_2041741 [Boletus coccyginus]|nr:hypothetical protein HD554DRAFT_2041741 [Boletus coccyginus]
MCVQGRRCRRHRAHVISVVVGVGKRLSARATRALVGGVRFAESQVLEQGNIRPFGGAKKQIECEKDPREMATGQARYVWWETVLRAMQSNKEHYAVKDSPPSGVCCSGCEIYGDPANRGFLLSRRTTRAITGGLTLAFAYATLRRLGQWAKRCASMFGDRPTCTERDALVFSNRDENVPGPGREIVTRYKPIWKKDMSAGKTVETKRSHGRPNSRSTTEAVVLGEQRRMCLPRIETTFSEISAQLHRATHFNDRSTSWVESSYQEGASATGNMGSTGPDMHVEVTARNESYVRKEVVLRPEFQALMGWTIHGLSTVGERRQIHGRATVVYQLKLSGSSLRGMILTNWKHALKKRDARSYEGLATDEKGGSGSIGGRSSPLPRVQG